MGHWWNDMTAETRSTQRKTCHSTTLSTMNMTWTDPESNTGLRSGSLTANRLSHVHALYKSHETVI